MCFITAIVLTEICESEKTLQRGCECCDNLDFHELDEDSVFYIAFIIDPLTRWSACILCIAIHGSSYIILFAAGHKRFSSILEIGHASVSLLMSLFCA